MPDTSSVEQFVAQQLASGRYRSREELIEAALRLRQARESALDHIADALRPALQDYLRGERGAEVDMAAIKAAGRKRLEQSPDVR
jgi:putative addiction module CopG family antidote